MKTNIGAHTLTARFDDEKQSLDGIIKALNDVGYTVGEPVVVAPE